MRNLTPKESTMSEPVESSRNQSASSSHHKRGRRWILAGLAATVIGALSLAGISYADNGGTWRGHHGGMGMHDALDPAQMDRHVDDMVNHLVADGTSEQKAKIAAIAKAALTDLQPLREKHHAAHEQAIKLLTARSIDRAALERLRADELQLADQLSRRLTQAFADSAEVMTPEQRAKLAEHIKHQRG